LSIFPPTADYFVRRAREKLLKSLQYDKIYHEKTLICGEKIYHLFVVKDMVEDYKFKAGI
jgi:hypothetical protein